VDKFEPVAPKIALAANERPPRVTSRQLCVTGWAREERRERERELYAWPVVEYPVAASCRLSGVSSILLEHFGCCLALFKRQTSARGAGGERKAEAN